MTSDSSPAVRARPSHSLVHLLINQTVLDIRYTHLVLTDESLSEDSTVIRKCSSIVIRLIPYEESTLQSDS